MLPSHLLKKSLMDIVTGFELHLHEKADTFSYLVGEAEFALKPIHDTKTPDICLVHSEAVYVKLHELDVPKKTCTVLVTRNEIAGIKTNRKLVLHISKWNTTNSWQNVKYVGGLHYDTSIGVKPSEWVDALIVR